MKTLLKGSAAYEIRVVVYMHIIMCNSFSAEYGEFLSGLSPFKEYIVKSLAKVIR